MKVLWLCNIVLPDIAKHLEIPVSNGGGWLIETSKQLSSEDNALLVCSPSNDGDEREGTCGNIRFYLFDSRRKDLDLGYAKIIKDYSPDVIHIFGTEYSHTLSMIKAAEKEGLLDKTIINIQGLVSVYTKHFYAGLDNKTVHSYTIRDVLRHSNIYRQMLDFKRRGECEEEALRLARHVIGRTDWDKACVTRINPDINYHFCNETLRKSFYENAWDIDKCEKHSIFVSQSNYPIKGFHYMLEAMADVVKAYPDAQLYTTGNSPLKINFMQKIRQGYYNRYIGKLIKKYHLENNVTFLGFLDEEKMCERFLKSNVFVSCSSIENSPNSVGEAMILGVPVVTSDVGGVKNMLTHEKEGFVYQADAPYMLSYYVKRVFEDKNLALQFSENAKLHAKETHNKEKNFKDLLKIYNKLCNK